MSSGARPIAHFIEARALDRAACDEGYVSITPLQPDMTAHTGAPAWLGRLETDG